MFHYNTQLNTLNNPFSTRILNDSNVMLRYPLRLSSYPDFYNNYNLKSIVREKKKNLMYSCPSIRYPTPPITPPSSVEQRDSIRTTTTTTTTMITETSTTRTTDMEILDSNSQLKATESPVRNDAGHLRTQTVIMKIGYVSEKDTIFQYQQSSRENFDIHNKEQSPSEEMVSSSNRKFLCEWIDCNRYFNDLESLALHVTQSHTLASRSDGLYYCGWSGCQRIGRGFNARYKMLVHMRTHTKEKPHQCHLCEKRFSRAENLKIHIRSHSGEKPYLCTFEGCTKAYSNSSDRFKHTRTHSVEKPYVCKVHGCQKRYTDPSSLRKHVKTFKHSLQLIKDVPKHVKQMVAVQESSEDQRDPRELPEEQLSEMYRPPFEKWPMGQQQDGDDLVVPYERQNFHEMELEHSPRMIPEHEEVSKQPGWSSSIEDISNRGYPLAITTEGSLENVLSSPQEEDNFHRDEIYQSMNLSTKENWQSEQPPKHSSPALQYPFFSTPLYDLSSYDSLSTQSFADLHSSPSVSTNTIILPSSYVPTESLFNAALDWEPLDLRINRI